jgi:hypothetical protein
MTFSSVVEETRNIMGKYTCLEFALSALFMSPHDILSVVEEARNIPGK